MTDDLDDLLADINDHAMAAARRAAARRTPTNSEFVTLLGSIVQGASLKTAAECLGYSVEDVMGYVENDATALGNLFSVMVNRCMRGHA